MSICVLSSFCALILVIYTAYFRRLKPVRNNLIFWYCTEMELRFKSVTNNEKFMPTRSVERCVLPEILCNLAVDQYAQELGALDYCEELPRYKSC